MPAEQNAQLDQDLGTRLHGASPRTPSFSQQLLDATNIDRLNIGALKTIALNWLQPHEGNIVDFLFPRPGPSRTAPAGTKRRSPGSEVRGRRSQAEDRTRHHLRPWTWDLGLWTQKNARRIERHIFDNPGRSPLAISESHGEDGSRASPAAAVSDDGRRRDPGGSPSDTTPRSEATSICGAPMPCSKRGCRSSKPGGLPTRRTSSG